ncbi:MAG TPA: hypothetical protein VMI94_28765 [Bryobacteraceae bacterium]|nr:hypothetical protein [Bryobacteraceae bacterium]
MAGNNAGEELQNPHVRHEPGDVNAIFLTKFGIGMALLIIVFLFGLWGLFEYFVKREAVLSLPPPGAMVSAQKLPPEPRLQPHPVADMQKMLAEENRAMQEYGWVDQSRGIVRIPVERAMDIIARNGLPATAPPAAPSHGKKP